MTAFLKFREWLFVYLGITLLFFFVAGTHFPHKGILLFQLVMALSIVGLWFFLSRVSCKFRVFASCLFLFQLFWISAFRLFNRSFYGNPLGYNPQDSSFYHELGRRFANLNIGISDLIPYLEKYTYGLDDCGFSAIVAFFYYFWGVDVGFALLALCNAFCVVIGAVLLYRLAKRFVSETLSRAVCLLWAVLPFSLYTASVGLKENYMVLMVILSIYYMYRYMESHRLVYLLLWVAFASSLLLFRTAIFFMLALAFLFSMLLSSRSFTRNVNFWLVILGILAFVFFAVIVDFIGGVRGDVDSTSLGRQGEILEESQGTLVVMLTNLLSVLIGPFPSFISDPVKVNYITLYNFGTMAKMMLSFFYLYGILRIMKNRDVRFYPLLIFIVCHSLMLVVAFYSLHDRYQWPQIPFVFLISLYGFREYQLHKTRQLARFSSIYTCLMVCLIIYYNLRVV